MGKRILSLCMALVLCVFILPFPTLAGGQDGALATLQAASDRGDTYPSKYRDAGLDQVVDEWNFYNRECTSFVAWCLNSRNGVAFHNWMGGMRWGHAKTWGTTAQALGYAVNNSPAVGSVAWSNKGTYGHVAWVSAVSGNQVTVEEYNYNYDGRFNSRTVASSSFTGFIHISDPNPGVDFSPWDSQRGLTFIGETNASIGQHVSVSGGTCTDTGMELYDANGNFLARGANGYFYDPVYFNINDELGYTLTKGTTYKYKFFAVVNGQTYWSGEGSFTTPGRFYLDVNGLLDDREEMYNITGCGTFDLYLNGQLAADDVDDFYSEDCAPGTTYSISDIRVAKGKAFGGFSEGSRTGTITADTNIRMRFYTIPNALEPETNVVTEIYNGHTYIYAKRSSTWYAAKELSERMGGHLVTISSAEENQFVTNLSGGLCVWAGATDAFHEGEWAWVNGETFSYSNWLSGEPNNYQGNDEGSENYMHLCEDGTWNDNTGCVMYPFICEIDSAVTPSPVNPDTPQIAVENRTGFPGSALTIPVTIKNNPGISGATLITSYDKSVLTLKGITKGSVFANGTYTAYPETAVMQWYHTENVTEDGTLFTLQFEVNENASNGNYTIAVGVRDGIPANLSNADSEIVDAQFISGVLEITSGVRGDVTGDSVVAINDVVKVARAVAGNITLSTQERAMADVTGDGVVAINDVVKLARYVAGNIASLQSAEAASLSDGESAVIEVATVRGAPGRTVRVPVSITSNPGIAGAQLNLSFDEGLTLKNIATGDVLSAGTFNPDVSAGKVQWYYDQANVTNTGVLFTLEFEVNADAKNGDAYAIAVNVTDGITVNLSDYDSNPVNAEFKPGEIQINETADNAVINTVSRNGSTVTANVVCANGNASVFCGVYNNSGKMIAVRSVQVTSESNYQFQFDGQRFDYAKAFIVDSNFCPLCEAKRT